MEEVGVKHLSVEFGKITDQTTPLAPPPPLTRPPPSPLHIYLQSRLDLTQLDQSRSE